MKTIETQLTKTTEGAITFRLRQQLRDPRQHAVTIMHGKLLDVPVIYVQHGSGAGHPLAPDAPSWPLHPRIAPRADEPVVHKHSCSSFFDTSLQTELAARQVAHLLVTGCMTEYCVDTACRHATTLGYDVTRGGDAHTTCDNEVLTAAQIIAHHNYVLHGFRSGGYAVAVKPAGVITFSNEASKQEKES